MITMMPKTLSKKLLLVLFLIGFIPYLLILIYTKTFGEEQILESNIERENAQITQIITSIDEHVAQLKHSLLFLSYMENMDDIVVEDLDQRILGMIEAYQKVLGVEADLFVLNTKSIVVASTDLGEITHTYPFVASTKQLFQVKTLPDKTLEFSVPIYSHRLNHTLLGYLLLRYPISNFDRFNLQTNAVHTAIINPKLHFVVGKNNRNTLSFDTENGMIEDERSLTLYQQIKAPLQNWYLVYQLDKDHAFIFLQQLNYYLIITALIGMFIIALLSHYLAKRIVAPIRKLQGHTQQIVQEHRYDFRIAVNTQDEIGELGTAFNILSDDIEKVMGQLKEESALSLMRLTQLIELVQRLLQSQNEQECLHIAIKALNAAIPEHPVSFKEVETPQAPTAIYLYDFEHQAEYYYGSLLINDDLLLDDESAFFSAVTAMITARLNQLRAFKRLKQEDEAKRTFISYLSHELRTPLHAILTHTQYLISYESLSDAQLDKVAHIENASQQLLQLINDLLDLARLKAGKYDVQLQSVSFEELTSLVSNIMDLLSPLAEQKELDYSLDVHDANCTVLVDPRLLRQIISNLFSNALKFTENGMIKTEIALENKQLIITISDSGCGIDPMLIETLFDPFVQYKHDDNVLQNSGVGLALSQGFAALFDAKLLISSDGKGLGTQAKLIIKTI